MSIISLIIMQLTIYLVCFDLGDDAREWNKQILYWINYLQSFLSTSDKEKWRLLIVGLRADKISGNASNSKDTLKNSVLSWQEMWPHLPLFPEVFITSSQGSESTSSVEYLWRVVKKECESIMQFATSIPSSYLHLLRAIEQEPKMLVPLQNSTWPILPSALLPALHYLHAVGDIVLLDNEKTVCTRPAEISSLMACFISPESVQQRLLHINEGEVAILSTNEVGKILLLTTNSPKYAQH